MKYFTTAVTNFIMLSLVLYIVNQKNITGTIISAAITSIAAMFLTIIIDKYKAHTKK